MPAKDGFTVLEEINFDTLFTRVVVLTAAEDDRDVIRVIRLGTRGVVLKQSAVDLLIQEHPTGLCRRDFGSTTRMSGNAGCLNRSMQYHLNINPLFKDGVYDPGKTAGKKAIHFTRKLAQGIDTREIDVDAVVAKQGGMSALGRSVHALFARSPVTGTTK